ncbi:MAG: DUF2249 domain-containing protein [Gammaproteobacteria bacterium]
MLDCKVDFDAVAELDPATAPGRVPEEVILDVSGLEPPEPLVLTLAAAERLPQGQYLRMLHRREPCLLFGYLEQRGFSWRMREGKTTAYEVLIWRNGDTLAEEAAQRAGIAP